MPKVYEQLMGIRQKLETHYKEMQDIEFTVQDGTLYMLQTRTGKRTGTAAVRIAVEMVKEGLIDEKTAVKRVSPDSLNHLLLPQLDPKAKVKPVAQGIAASPGAAGGKVVLSAEAAVEHAEEHPNEPIMLVRKETSPEDVAGMHLAKGILTAPAARPATRRSSPAAGASPASSAARRSRSTRRPAQITIAGQTVKAGDFLTINGTTGDVMIGKVPTVDPDDHRRLRHADGAGPTRPGRSRSAPTPTPPRTPPRPASSAPRGSASAGPSTCSSARSGSSPCGR